MIEHVIASVVVISIILGSYLIGRNLGDPQGFVDSVLASLLGAMCLAVVFATAFALVGVYNLVLGMVVVL